MADGISFDGSERFVPCLVRLIFRTVKSRFPGLSAPARSARIPGRIPSNWAAVNAVGCEKSNGLPFQKMLEPETVNLPVPSGDRSSRSFARFVELALPAGSKYRPMPPRTTVLASCVAVQANPRVGDKFAGRGDGAPNPLSPTNGRRSEGFVRS